jgi:hypothetical protein
VHKDASRVFGSQPQLRTNSREPNLPYFRGHGKDCVAKRQPIQVSLTQAANVRFLAMISVPSSAGCGRLWPVVAGGGPIPGIDPFLPLATGSFQVVNDRRRYPQCYSGSFILRRNAA